VVGTKGYEHQTSGNEVLGAHDPFQPISCRMLRRDSRIRIWWCMAEDGETGSEGNCKDERGALDVH